jgi:hypothetical protein
VNIAVAVATTTISHEKVIDEYIFISSALYMIEYTESIISFEYQLRGDVITTTIDRVSVGASK